MGDTVLTICVLDASTEMPKDANLETRFRYAARRAHHFWLSVDDELRFRGAVGALLVSANDEETTMIESTIDGLRKVTAMVSAAQSGLIVGLPILDDSDRPRPLPLLLWFREERDA